MKISFKLRVLGILTALLLTESVAYAAETSTAKVEGSNRVKNKLGSYLAISEPAPTAIGVNLAYNVTDFLKASVGYGNISVSLGSYEASASTFGFGVRGMIPNWDFTPTLGIHYGHVSYAGQGLEVGGFTESGGHIYASLGFDWQTATGFNLNGGYRQSFKSGIGGGIYLGAGWFVNWLG
jgi:hypothetical protein